MGFLDFFTDKNKDDKKEDLLSVFGLDSYERDVVKKNDYNFWNFEEEDLEEDDFYYEDDETSLDSKNFSTSDDEEDDNDEW